MKEIKILVSNELKNMISYDAKLSCSTVKDIIIDAIREYYCCDTLLDLEKLARDVVNRNEIL